ncbi:MAG TPA: DUF6252 family protein [Flavobacterium sp.]|nr:DUF6252 family protein [Flavobacterium sp.]
MKKVFALLLMITALVSCESDVKFNDPGFQGRKDNFVWQADVASAYTLDGYTYVNAYRGLESVILRFPTPPVEITQFNPITYTYRDTDGDDGNDELDDVSASYQFTEQGSAITYYTGQNSLLEDPGNVEVTINKCLFTQGIISGEFKFNAKYEGESDLVPSNVNFQQGVFYNVPLTQQ